MSDAFTFWQGIAKLPEQAQKSFWDAGAALSGFLGEPPQPRALKLEYDFSKPPAGAAWWERLLFYIGQGQVNQSVAQLQAAQSSIEGAKWLWLALQGDFNKSPTTGQVITGGIISMIPLVDQACDVRDVIANCLTLESEEARKDPENWMALGLTCIGFVPEFGSAVKTVGKVAIKKATRLLDLLKNMEWIDKHFKALKVGRPWGFAPLAWLKKYDWIGAAKLAASKAKAAFEKALKVAQRAAEYAIGAVKTKLHQLANLFKEIAAKIGSAITDACKRIKARITEMLGGARKEAGNFDAAPGKAPNKHLQNEAEPPKRTPGKPPHMEPHKPKCFKPGDELRKNWKGDPKKLEKEFYEQLKAQEAGLNKLTVGEYIENRAKFEQIGRGTGAAQEAARGQLSTEIYDSVLETLEGRGQVGAAAKAAAREKTKDIMSGLAALHDPDMIAGGKDQIQRLGDTKVNSSIGSQWSKDSRVKEMDRAAEDALKSQGPNAKMHVKLDRCK